MLEGKTRATIRNVANYAPNRGAAIVVIDRALKATGGLSYGESCAFSNRSGSGVDQTLQFCEGDFGRLVVVKRSHEPSGLVGEEHHRRVVHGVTAVF